LEDTERELICRSSCEPETEGFIGLLQVLINYLESLEPGHKQVTVLKHHPVAFHGSSFNKLPSLFSHTLTKSQELEFIHSNADSFDQFLHITLGIGSWTQNENYWCSGG
jgi:hypothetical protein